MDKLPTIVILPGWRVASKRYDNLKKYFVDAGYAAYVFGFAGFEKDKPLTKMMTLTDYADSVSDFISEKKIKKAILIGHSFGGRVALSLSSNNPDWIAGMVLTGVPGFAPVSSVKRRLFFILSKMGKILFLVPLFRPFAGIAKKLLYRSSGSVDYLRTEGAIKETFQSIIRVDLEPFMRKTKIPVLLLWGEKDSMVPMSVARRMNQVIPGSRLATIPEGNHAIPFDNIRDFYRLFDAFYKKNL